MYRNIKRLPIITLNIRRENGKKLITKNLNNERKKEDVMIAKTRLWTF